MPKSHLEDDFSHVPNVVYVSPLELKPNRVLIGLGIGAIVIALGTLGYLLVDRYFLGEIATEVPRIEIKKKPPTTDVSTPSAQKDETEDWKTFTHSENSFSIKYPKNWVVKEEKTVNNELTVNFGEDSNFNGKVPYFSVSTTSDGRGAVPFDSYDQIEQQEIDESTETDNPSYPTYTVNRFKDTTVDGEKALKYELEPKVAGDGLYNLGTVVKREALFFRISLWAEKKPLNDAIKTLDLMLSTFKFLD